MVKKKTILIVVFLLFCTFNYLTAVNPVKKKALYRFIIIPKVMHPWFDLVHEGAVDAASMLEEWTGSKFIIEYLPPQKADINKQNIILKQAIETNPDGLMIDLLDAELNRPLLELAEERGVKIIIFDSKPPEGMNLTSIGNDFEEQAQLASHRLAELIGNSGEVAIMMGVPSAPNHMIRARAHEETFSMYPNIHIVAKGIDNDNIETARKQAAEIMKLHPNLKGWVSCDAAGPIGIGQAIIEAGKKGKVLSVGTDDLPQVIAFIKNGVIDSSTSTKPKMQGYWSVLTLWQATLGIHLPKQIDTGIAIITRRMTSDYQGF